MQYHNEISQENNPNATARLFIQDNGLLYKEYFNFNELTQKNIENLLVIAQTPQLQTIRALTLPVKIVRKSGRVIGYTMPYHKGRTLWDFVNDDAVPFGRKLNCFRQLAEVITRLPEGVFVGDLHMKNVLVDSRDQIHLIDIDGFSLAQGHLLTCPMNKVIQKDGRLQGEKYAAISRNTDILCFYDAFLYLLLGRIYFTMYAHGCFLDYLTYLEQTGFPRALVEDIRCLFSDEPNRLTVSALDAIDPKKAEDYSFRAYSNHLRK